MKVHASGYGMWVGSKKEVLQGNIFPVFGPDVMGPVRIPKGIAMIRMSLGLRFTTD